MKQYKNCNGCKALTYSPASKCGGMQCSLGYSTKDGKQIMGITVENIPLEPCDKPKTNTELNYLYSLNNKL